jgi:DNA-binding response OmpR family regulator
VQQHLSERVEARRVLLVEPEQEVRGILQEILEHRGYHVIPAENGEAARQGVAREDPDIALIEVMLNDECGAALGEEFVAAGLPVIVVTGHADAAWRLESRSLWRLNKPLRGDALNMMIQEILSGPHLRPGEVIS